MPTEYQTLGLEEVDDGILRLTLDRPDRLNAMNHTLVAELHAALDEVDGDRGARAVILTGAGRGFCAGLDLREGATPPEVGATGAFGDGGRRGRVQVGLETQQHIATLVPHLRSLRIPVIAAVNGAATGGGLALVLGSDIRLAGSSARFGVAFVRIGLSGCDIGVSWALPRVVGAARAQELMLTGRIVDSAEAERIGLVVRVVADDELADAALEVARQVRANSPFGTWMTKEAMWAALEIPSQQAAIDLENRQQILASMTDDMGEAVRAFLEKRDPDFTDR